VAAIRERKNADGTVSFHCQVRKTGWPTRTASFRTRKLAKEWAATVEAEMIEGRHFKNAAARRRTLAEAIDKYIAEELPKKKSGENHRSALPWWKEHIGNLKLADVTPDVVAAQKNKLANSSYTRAKPKSKRSVVKDGEAAQFKRSPATVNRFLACLSHVFTIAIKEWRWANVNPCAAVRKFKEGKGRVRTLSDKERKKLLAVTVKDPVLHTFVVIALSTACRAGELLKLTWADVDFEGEQLLFRDTKNTEPRTAWLHGDALRLLKAYAKARRLDTERVFANSTVGPYEYGKPFNAACEEAGIEEFRFHDLRHTAATELARLGSSEQQLRAIGGWKSGVVKRYVHLAANDAKAVMKKLSAKVDAK
jgi:integrase